MSFVLQDVLGAVVALPVIFAIIMLPGRFLAGILGFPGFAASRDPLERAGISLLVGCATAPVLLDLAGRAGPRAMVAAAVALSLLGVAASLQNANWRLGDFLADPSMRLFIAIFVGWTATATFLLIDLPEGEGLRRSLLSVDHVKHAAATWAVAQWGTPPENPTFFDPNVQSAYYYFFYNLTATALLIVQPLGVAARQAVWASVVMVGVALFALARLVYLRWNIQRGAGESGEKTLVSWLLVLLLTTGLDILPVTLVGRLFYGVWISDVEGWDTQVTSWLNSLLWTPHHVCAFLAAWVGFVALAEAPEGGAARWRVVALAGLAFASCAGLSIYVAIGAAATIAMWLCWLAMAHRSADIFAWLGAGAAAAIVGGPWLASLVEGRLMAAGGSPPIAFEIRALPIIDPLISDPVWRASLRLLAAPFAYAIEFGVYLVGSILFWRRAGSRGLDGDLAKLLVLGTIASFVIGTFLRSTILLNDLGWRVMLFAQLATLVWTLAALQEGLFHAVDADGRRPYVGVLWTCVCLGFAANLYGAFQLRTSDFEKPEEVAMAPAERDAWEWLSANLPAGAVVQEYPDRPRAFAYGLYGHFREAVSDHFNGILFGSSKPAVQARIREASPLFVDTQMTLETALATARRLNIQFVVIRSLDPVFSSPTAWPWSVDAVYANKYMRAIEIAPRAERENGQ